MKTSVNIDKLISRVTKEAIKEYDKEQRSKQKKNVYHNTRLLLKHYKDLKEHSEKAKFYIEGVPYEQIVKHFNCGVNTPRRWMNEMIKELSILLFGIDGLKLDMVR